MWKIEEPAGEKKWNGIQLISAKINELTYARTKATILKLPVPREGEHTQE